MMNEIIKGGNQKSNDTFNTNSTNLVKKEKTIDLANTYVSLFDNTYQTENPKQITLKTFLDDIKSSEINKTLFEKASKLRDKGLLTDFKRSQLFAITLSIACKNRKKGSFAEKVISYSDSIQIDLDNIPPDKVEETKKVISNDKHTLFCFNSISGRGLKVAFLIDHSRHKESFNAIEEYFRTKYNITIDLSTSDIARLCFSSFDPDIYINEYAEPFLLDDSDIESKRVLAHNMPNTDKNSVPFRLDEVKKQKASRTGRRTEESGPVIDSQKTLLMYLKQILIEYGEAGKRHNGRMKAGRVFGNYLSQTSYNLDQAINILLDFIKENKLSDDFELAESELREFIQYGMNYKKTFKVSHDKSERPFWTYSEDDSGKLKLSVDTNLLLNFLSKSGISYVNLSTESDTNYRFVSIQNNIIENVDEGFISRLLRNFIEESNIDSFEKGQLIGELFRMIPYLTDPKRLPFGVLNIEVKFHRDTKDSTYFYFANTVVEVTKNGIKEIDYSDIDGVVWKNQIIDSEFKLRNNEDEIRSMFYKFLEKTCTDPQTLELDKDRHEALLISIGYMCHRFKNPRTNKSIILSENNIGHEANGRTGKSLIMNAISKIRKVLKLDGRRIKIESEFVFQNLDYDTDLIYFDDINRFFKFENFYTSISEGIRFRRIYEAEQWIPFNNSPKFVLSTNYGLQGNSESDKGRKFDMELLSYYNSVNTPAVEFDCHFFEEWDEEEWNSFYNDMIAYSKIYLRNNAQLKEYKSDTIELRKLISAIGQDFYDFAESLTRDEFLTNTVIYSNYVSFLGLDESDISKKGIAYKIKTYCQYLGLEYESTQQRVNGKNCRGYIIYSNSTDTQSAEMFVEVA